MTWRDLWMVAVGQDPPVQHFSPITAAMLVYSLIFVLCFIMYRSSFLLPGGLQIYAVEFFKTMTFCSYPYGHMIIRQYYGHVGYFCAMVPLVTLTVLVFSVGEGSILAHWLSLLQRKCSPWKFLSSMVVQLLAGLAAYRLGRLIYTLDLHWTFKQVLSQVECTSDLQVNFAIGFLVETLGVTFDLWMFSQKLANNRVLDLLLKHTNTAMIVCLGVKKTGMYINPIMATGLTFGCRGNTTLEHLAVYWAGPFLGVFLAVQLIKFVRLPGQKSAKEKDIEEQGPNYQDTNITSSNGNGIRKRKPKTENQKY